MKAVLKQLASERRSRADAACPRARRAQRPIDYWPGFVDALSTMLLVITFLLSVFMLAQFFLAREVTGKDTVLTKLNKQIAELTAQLALAQTNGRRAEHIADLSATLRANRKRTANCRARSRRGRRRRRRRPAPARRSSSSQAKSRSPPRRSRRSTFSISRSPLCAGSSRRSRTRSPPRRSRDRNRRRRSPISARGSMSRLAQKVQELARYRSDFFGRLRQILGDRPDIRIVGDRFVFQSEVLFETGKAEVESRREDGTRQARRRRRRAQQGNSAGNPLGSARRRPYRQEADPIDAISVELGVVRRPRHRGRAISDQQRRASRPARRRGLRRVPADRPRRQRGGLCQEPPHRIEADGEVSDPPSPRLRERGRSLASLIALVMPAALERCRAGSSMVRAGRS